jgi:Ser/Thr protein kinase RdoA (MazF antagonist)
VLAEFPDVGLPVEIVSVSPRPFSAASVVAVRGGRAFVKRHHGSVRDVEGLMEEHRFMAHLRANGVNVARVFEARAGRTAIEIGEWTYEVHGLPPGIDLYEEALSWTPFQSKEHARSAGETMARLHIAADGYVAPARPARPLVASFSIFAAQDAGIGLEEYLSARPALNASAATRRDCYEALGLLAPFHAALKPLLRGLKPLWTHNDLHASNLFWSDDSVNARATGVIDFGLADRTNAVYDVAQAIERNIVEWLWLAQNPEHREDAPIHLDHLRALLDGYDSVRSFTAEEAAALAPMMALCHAEFALTETDYFLSVLHSEEKARVASCDYLVGHAQWFRGGGGRKLLSAVRAWAAERERRKVRE